MFFPPFFLLLRGKIPDFMPAPGLKQYISPKWVFFDLDDTLWDFHANSAKALSELYNTTEYLLNIFPDYSVFQETYHRENDIVWELYHHAKITAEELKRRRFAVLLQGVFPEERIAKMALELNERYLDLLAKQTTLVADAEDLLRYAARKYLIGVLSNGFINVQYRKLYSTPLWRYVQRMIVSDEIGVTKPDSRIFRFAERAVGASSSECVMIGDNPDADILGAVNAGWQAIYFNKRGKECFSPGVREVSSLLEIKELL